MDPDTQMGLRAKGGWCLVGLLWGGFVLNYVDRQVVFSSLPVLTRLNPEVLVRLAGFGLVAPGHQTR
jgi:hypothetical protein